MSYRDEKAKQGEKIGAALGRGVGYLLGFTSRTFLRALLAEVERKVGEKERGR